MTLEQLEAMKATKQQCTALMIRPMKHVDHPIICLMRPSDGSVKLMRMGPDAHLGAVEN